MSAKPATIAVRLACELEPETEQPPAKGETQPPGMVNCANVAGTEKHAVPVLQVAVAQLSPFCASAAAGSVTMALEEQ
jgi:hypothetical protein